MDAFILEYDNQRSGGFEPLRFIRPSAQKVVLGLIATKHGQLEDRQQVCKRIKEAAQYVALDQICLNPQCGFASTEEGNNLTEQQQWPKTRSGGDSSICLAIDYPVTSFVDLGAQRCW